MDATAATSAAPAAAAEPTPSPAEALGAAVAQNPLDFNSWVQLVAHYEGDVRLEAPKRREIGGNADGFSPGGGARGDGRGHVRPLPGRVPALLRLLEQGAGRLGIPASKAWGSNDKLCGSVHSTRSTNTRERRAPRRMRRPPWT